MEIDEKCRSCETNSDFQVIDLVLTWDCLRLWRSDGIDKSFIKREFPIEI